MELHDLPNLAEIQDPESLDFVFNAHNKDREVLITRYRGTMIDPLEAGTTRFIGWQKSVYHFGGLNREVEIGAIVTTNADGLVDSLHFDSRCLGSQGSHCDFDVLEQRISEKLIGKSIPDIEKIFITAGDVQCLHVFEILAAIASFYNALNKKGLPKGTEQELVTLIPTDTGVLCRNRHQFLDQSYETEIVLTHNTPHKLNERNLCSYVDTNVFVRQQVENTWTDSLYAENFEGVYAQLNRLFSKCLRLEKKAFDLSGKVRFSMFPSLAGLFLLTFSHEGMSGTVDRAVKIEKILHFIQAGEGRTPCLGFDGDFGLAKRILFSGNN